MAITERVIISVTGDVENWKEQLKVLLQTLKQQKGYLRTRWGPHSEDQQKLELLIGWESVDICEAWKASPKFAETMGLMKPITAGPAEAYFITFVPYAPKEVIDASIVETVTFDNSSSSEDQLRAQVEKAKATAGCTGVASGMDTTGKKFVAIIGWSGLETSKTADKAYTSGASETHHVNFNFPIKGFGGL